MPRCRTLTGLANTAAEVCPNAPRWFTGLDLGQRQDHSALATLERIGARLAIRSLTRFPLGTSYEDLYRLITATVIPGGVPQVLAIDAAGPGLPIVDRLRQCNHAGLTLRAVFITGGHTPGTAKGGCLTVPRRKLVANLEIAIKTRALICHGKLHNRSLFERELATIDKPNKRDDLAIAVALALNAAI
ncbi:MAG: hypothetical protein HYX27_27640 [Acidobacteria bacterium]|nr:hypothetical protein [Acidobacteriota bacterium]